MTVTVDGDRTAEFGHLCEAATLGIAPEELPLLHARKRRKVAPAPVGNGAGRRPLLAGGKGAGGANDVPPPAALNFLGDLTALSGSTKATAAQHQEEASAIDAADDDDPWMANAHRLEASIAQMSDVLRRQEAQYADLYGCLRNVRLGGGAAMTDAERNALDAAVASFAVSTGNQIEALRRALASASAADAPAGTSTGGGLAAHRVGIVACLVSALRADVVDRIGRMHAVRMRRSLDLARDPLRCRLPATAGGDRGSGPGGLGGEAAFVIDDDDDDEATAHLASLLGNIRAAAMPKAARAREEAFCATYGQTKEERLLKEVAMPLPPFPRADDVADIDPDEQDGFEQEHRKSGPSSSRPNTSHSEMEHNASSAIPRQRRREELEVVPVDPSVQQYYGESAAEQEAYVEDLQRESAYLTASLQNELEDVHKIENKMMEITTLLRQFGDMVAEQQEDIVVIHEQAERSKKNVQAGQDNLVDAGERKKKSKHYMAIFIASMAMLLLFLNCITP